MEIRGRMEDPIILDNVLCNLDTNVVRFVPILESNRLSPRLPTRRSLQTRLHLQQSNVESCRGTAS